VAAPSPTPAPTSDPASAYIAEWQRRLPAFERGHRRFAGELRQDLVSVWFRERLMLGNRTTFDAALQGLLTDGERQRIETDPQFTRAWRIFVDLCWLKKQVTRLGMFAVLALLGALAVLFLVLGLPEVLGPGDR